MPATEVLSERDLVIEGPFESVWDAIEDDPAERERLKLLSWLMTAIVDHISGQGWTQKQAAKRLNVSQPRISDLTRGKMGLFSIDALVGMIGAAGLHIEPRLITQQPAAAASNDVTKDAA